MPDGYFDCVVELESSTCKKVKLIIPHAELCSFPNNLFDRKIDYGLRYHIDAETSDRLYHDLRPVNELGLPINEP